MNKWLIIALVFCARLACAQSQISGGQVSGGSITFSNSGPPGYMGSRTDRALTSALLPPNYPCPPLPGGVTCNSATQGQGLVNTNWITGVNSIVSDSNYNNIQIMRLTDYNDTQAPYNCPGATVGEGGSAEENIFEVNDNYIILNCTSGAIRMKTFNPNTMQTTGYVTGWPSGGGYGLPGSGEWDYVNAGTVYLLVGNLIDRYTVSGSAVATGPTIMADFSYGVPCWQSTWPCGDWTSGTIQPGTNIVPLTNNSATHSFQLMNLTACADSGSYPNFNSSTTSSLTIIADGACNWVDMGPVNVSPSFITHVYPGTVSHNGQFAAGLANYQGDGGNGSCFVVYYDPSAGTYGTYWSLNSCTGNAYKFVSTAAGPQPVSGTGTFVNNVILGTNPTTQDLVALHNVKIDKSGTYLVIGPQKCAYPSGPNCPLAGGDGEFFWNVEAGTEYWPNPTGSGFTPGHHSSGYGELISLSGYTSANPYYYSFGTPMGGGAISTYFYVNSPACTPNACGTNSPFDYHSSSVYQNSSNTHSTCEAALSNSYGANGWPFQYPFEGEVVCFPTNGSTSIFREGFSYNTYSSTNFNVFANIGSESSDGKFWALSTDWWCTLGTTTGGSTPYCGFNWQPSHTYNLGDWIAPGTNNASIGNVYTALSCTGACTTGSTVPNWNANCPNVGDSCPTDGTIVWKNIGVNNQGVAVMIYKLQ